MPATRFGKAEPSSPFPPARKERGIRDKAFAVERVLGSRRLTRGAFGDRHRRASADSSLAAPRSGEDPLPCTFVHAHLTQPVPSFSNTASRSLINSHQTCFSLFSCVPPNSILRRHATGGPSMGDPVKVNLHSRRIPGPTNKAAVV